MTNFTATVSAKNQARFDEVLQSHPYAKDRGDCCCSCHQMIDEETRKQRQEEVLRNVLKWSEWLKPRQ